MSVYWLGKCRECKYHSGLSFGYGLYWDCDLYGLPMASKQLAKKCPGDVSYPRDKGDKSLYTGDEKIFNLQPLMVEEY